MSSAGMPRGRVGCSAAALATEAERRPSSFKAGTSRTMCGPPPMTVGMVGEVALALYYKSEQSLASQVCNKPASPTCFQMSPNYPLVFRLIRGFKH